MQNEEIWRIILDTLPICDANCRLNKRGKCFFFPVSKVTRGRNRMEIIDCNFHMSNGKIVDELTVIARDKDTNEEWELTYTKEDGIGRRKLVSTMR